MRMKLSWRKRAGVLWRSGQRKNASDKRNATGGTPAANYLSNFMFPLRNGPPARTHVDGDAIAEQVLYVYASTPFKSLFVVSA